MLMDFKRLVKSYKMKLNGVLHVGAHLAEEAEEYHGLRAGRVWWVEANPAVTDKILAKLASYPKQTLINALVYSEDGVDLGFNVTNIDGMSSSIYEFGTHTGFSPEIKFVDRLTLPTSTLDTLVAQHGIQANFLNLDLQGAEGPALRGASALIGQLDYVMTEVNKDQVYVGCTQVSEIDDILADFTRVDTYWVGDQGWGDALYIRTSLLGA